MIIIKMDVNCALERSVWTMQDVYMRRFRTKRHFQRLKAGQVCGINVSKVILCSTGGSLYRGLVNELVFAYGAV